MPNRPRSLIPIASPSALAAATFVAVGFAIAVAWPASAQAQRCTPLQWDNPSPSYPSGVTHHAFHSPSMNVDVGFDVYLPPGFAGSSQRFPVLYYLHGRGGDEGTMVANMVAWRPVPASRPVPAARPGTSLVTAPDAAAAPPAPSAVTCGNFTVTPYQLHHGDQDTVVALAMDQVLDGISMHATMLTRVRNWYAARGLF